MIYEMIFSYLAIGAAWIAIEMFGGAAAALGRACAKEAYGIPHPLMPLGALLVAVILIFALSLVIAVWPYFVWDEYRRGELFKPGRWDDIE